MTRLEAQNRAVGPRRVIAVDLDWAETDVLADLLRRPELHVEIVAGADREDPGVRAAALCGVPTTCDLEAALAGSKVEIVLVGAHSARRRWLSDRFRAMGSRVADPRGFVAGLAVDVTGFQTPDPAARPLNEMLAEAIPDLDPAPRLEAAAGISSTFAWVAPEAFLDRVQDSLDRAEGEPWRPALHRIHLIGDRGEVERWREELPRTWKSASAGCFPDPETAVLLEPRRPRAARARGEHLELARRDRGPVFAAERAVLWRPGDAEAFLALACDWVGWERLTPVRALV